MWAITAHIFEIIVVTVNTQLQIPFRKSDHIVFSGSLWTLKWRETEKRVTQRRHAFEIWSKW